MDPLTEQFSGQSPYMYCGGDPVNRVDPTGLEWYSNDQGQYAFIAGHDEDELKSQSGNHYHHEGATITFYTSDGIEHFGDDSGNVSQMLNLPDVTCKPTDNTLNYLFVGPGQAPGTVGGNTDSGSNNGTSGSGDQKLRDGVTQLTSIAATVWGVAEKGGQYLCENNGGKTIGKLLGFGTQRKASALTGTVKYFSTAGKIAGIAGYTVSAVSIGSKLINGEKISAAEGTGFGISTLIVGAGWIATGTVAAPAVATGALIYGGAELGSYLFTGNSLEENILGK